MFDMVKVEVVVRISSSVEIVSNKCYNLQRSKAQSTNKFQKITKNPTFVYLEFNEHGGIFRFSLQKLF